MGTDGGSPPRQPRDGEEGALVARLRALGYTVIDVEALVAPGTEGMTLAERLERLLGRPDDAGDKQGHEPR